MQTHTHTHTYTHAQAQTQTFVDIVKWIAATARRFNEHLGMRSTSSSRTGKHRRSSPLPIAAVRVQRVSSMGMCVSVCLSVCPNRSTLNVQLHRNMYMFSIRVYIPVCVYVYIYIFFIHVFLHSLCMYEKAFYTCICMYMYIYIYIYIHTYMY